jgi:hypothetical protein
MNFVHYKLNIWWVHLHILMYYDLALVIRSPPIGVEKFNFNQFQYFITLYYIIIMDANAIEFIHMNVHLWLVISLYLTINLVSVHS